MIHKSHRHRGNCVNGARASVPARRAQRAQIRAERAQAGKDARAPFALQELDTYSSPM